MSWHGWHTYGYGVKVSELQNISMSKVVELIQTAPEYAKSFNDWLKNNDIKEPTLEDLEEFDEDYCIGLATVLAAVICEREGIELTACNDFENETYLLYAQTYPWYLSDKEKTLKEQDIRLLLVRYFSKITDEVITIDYYDPENSG